MNEAQFQDRIVGLARTLGWKVMHVGIGQTNKGYRVPIRYDGKGYPDLTMVHPQLGILFVEVKSQKGRVRPEQQTWLDNLADAAGWCDDGIAVRPVRAEVWRPSDWDSGLIEQRLRRG